jgi:rhamnosyltransferase
MSTSILAGIVTYQPNIPHLVKTVEQLQVFATSLVIIDNGSSAVLVRDLHHLQAKYPTVHFIFGTNRGVGAAHNDLVRLAIDGGCDQVLLLDQDTSIDVDFLESIKTRLDWIISVDSSAVAVGPLLFDDATKNTLIRAVDSRESRDRRVVFLPASGMLALVSAFISHGLFREDYFIDHVDREWGERLSRSGSSLYCATDIPVHHELGDALPNGKRPSWPYHSHPRRDYYLIRNHFLTCRDLEYRPGSMMLELARITHWAMLTLIRSPRRHERAYWMARGLADAMGNRSGPLGAVRSRVVAGTLNPPRANTPF